MSIEARVLTIAEFQAFANKHERDTRRFELLDGEIIEMPSNAYSSVVANIIAYLIQHWLISTGRKGYVSGEGGGYIVNGQVFAPDVAYMRHLPTNKGYEQTPPLLAVEVISDPQSSAEQTDLRRKLVHYRQANVVVWIVDYVARQVEVHIPDQPVEVYGDAESVPGGDVLPEFTLPVKDIFPEETTNA